VIPLFSSFGEKASRKDDVSRRGASPAQRKIRFDVDDDFERIKPATTFTTTETNEVVGVLEKKNENMRRRARRLRGVRERGGVFERFGREIDVVGGRESIIFWRTRRRRRRRRQKVQETRSEKDD
jgi:hypothetical protein